jgi:phage gpG-like protein
VNIRLRLQSSDLRQILSRQQQRELLRVAGREFWLITRETFGAGGFNRPRPWAPLAERTKREYSKRGINPLVPTLLRAGTLMNSIRQRVEDMRTTIYSDHPDAAAHQFGDWHRHLPARPFMPITPDGQQLTAYAEGRILRAMNAVKL